MTGSSIHIGVLAALVGNFEEGAKDGIRGVEMAIAEFGGQVAGREIRLTVEPTAIMPDFAVVKAETLLDWHGVDYIVGPLSGNEGLALKAFAKMRPETTFINGVSAAQDLTLRDPAANFYNFAPHGGQATAGLADYAYHTLGYHRIVTVGEDYTYPYTQVGAFQLQYARAGGQIVERLWIPVGASDYQDIVHSIPPEADAILAAITGKDVGHFVAQYAQAEGRLPLLGGPTAFDPASLASLDESLSEHLVGAVSSTPVVSNNPDPAWQDFVEQYRAQFDDALDYPSYYAWGYYLNTKASLLALRAVDGDLSDGQAAFRGALNRLTFDGPTGPVRLGHNRQALITNFIIHITRDVDGHLVQEIVQRIEDVDPTLGIPEAEYLAYGPFTRDNPPL